MKILMHLCCGPCTAYPLAVLRDQGHDVSGYFYNPNIHPFREFARRLAALKELAAGTGLGVAYVEEYGLTEYLRQVVHHEEKRCLLCYEMRLTAAARHARETGADAFTSSLLYSKYQQHALIRSAGERLAAEYGVAFYYQDFRIGWQQGIDMAVAMGLYRQPYCGCIYSERERYDPKLKKKRKAPGD